jgi:hypothetical protein
MVNREGKWAELAYAKVYYPYWPQGSAGHVVSRATAKYISDYSESLHRYQGEDVSIGIWMDEAAKKDAKNHLKDITYIQAKRMISNGGTQLCGNPKYLMIGHGLSPEEQYDCQLKIGNKKFSENAWLDDPAEFENAIDGPWGNTFASLWKPGDASAVSTPGSLYKSGGTSAGSTPMGYKGPWANSGGGYSNLGYRGSPTTTMSQLDSRTTMFQKGNSMGYRVAPQMQN